MQVHESDFIQRDLHFASDSFNLVAVTSRPRSRRAHGGKTICPVANTLDLIGDRWTLLVVRDLMFVNKHRFAEFLESAEGIPTNVLTDRLRRLEHCGLVRQTAYQRRPVRYRYDLTPMGADLAPVLREMILWANRHIAGTARPPAGFFERPQDPEKG